jgi:hypothetical protein
MISVRYLKDYCEQKRLDGYRNDPISSPILYDVRDRQDSISVVISFSAKIAPPLDAFHAVSSCDMTDTTVIQKKDDFSWEDAQETCALIDAKIKQFYSIYYALEQTLKNLVDGK